ncbi:MAG: hypothetical protein R6W06_06195 [Prochlorococcaceae cyanobacterium]
MLRLMAIPAESAAGASGSLYYSGVLWGHVKMRIPSLLALMALVGFLLIELVSWVVA